MSGIRMGLNSNAITSVTQWGSSEILAQRQQQLRWLQADLSLDEIFGGNCYQLVQVDWLWLDACFRLAQSIWCFIRADTIWAMIGLNNFIALRAIIILGGSTVIILIRSEWITGALHSLGIHRCPPLLAAIVLETLKTIDLFTTDYSQNICDLFLFGCELGIYGCQT